MRPMSFPSSLPLAAGLAIALSPSALADPAVSATPTRAGNRTDLRVEREPTLGAPGQRAALPRASDASPREGQNFNGQFVTMRDDLENFPLGVSLGGAGVSAAPTSFTGPPGFVWPLNNLRGQASTNFVRLVDLSLAPIGGANGVVNATRAIEIVTGTAQEPGGFFTGANLRFGGQPGEPTLPLAPTADHNARISAEYYISTIDQLFTFEPTATFVGFITGRLMWGGVCVENFPGDCTDLGLPIGLNPHIRALYGLPGDGSLFVPATYCRTFEGEAIAGCVPPPGFAIGDLVSPPIAAWSRFAFETRADGRMRFYLDLLDGSGEVAMYDNHLLTSGFIDRVSANTSYEVQDAFLLVDNIEASGPIFALPKAPPLDCPYLDDMEWLNTGPLLNQMTRWTVALSSAATVIVDGAQGQVIQQVNNVSSDNKYRREMSTELPSSFPTLANDTVTTVQVRTTGATVRGVALLEGNNAAARIFLGRETATTPYEPSVYVQINPDYDPIDDPFGNDPLANAPVIGVDVVDTQYDWQTGVCRTLEIRRSANGALRISIDGQRIFTGIRPGAVFPSRLAFESENNATGMGAQLRINDVALTCDAPSCAADFNLDDVIDFEDLNVVLSNFGDVGFPPLTIPLGDADGDTRVDFTDLNSVLAAFGTSCE